MASWEIEEEEVRHLFALPAGARAVTFFQLAADWDEVWGLKDAAGWITGRSTDALPLWPHSTFAEACARGDWAGSMAEALPVTELLEDLLPLLAEDGLGVAVFPSPDDQGVVMTPDEFRDRLEKELELGEG